MTDLVVQMNAVLEKMQIPLKAVWLPSDNAKEHSKIILEEGLLMVYDKDETEALRSLFHECLEYRFRSLISLYREIINKLIEGIEQITYREKERILDQIIKDFQVWRSLEAERLGSTNRDKKAVKS